MAEETVNFEEIAEWLKIYKTTDNEKQKKHLQNVITLASMPLVKKIARSLARRNTDPVEDIIQVGSVGLVKAIQLYNPNVSENFKTYATYLITGEINSIDEQNDTLKIVNQTSEIKARKLLKHFVNLSNRDQELILSFVKTMEEKNQD